MISRYCVCIVMLAGLAPGCSPDTAEEQVAVAASPVWPGASTSLDSSNQYAHVVAITDPIAPGSG